jgi:hypothetical protein
MIGVTSRRPAHSLEYENTIWSDILDYVRGTERPLKQAFRDALEAITQSYGDGYLSKDEFDVLMRQIVAILVEKELESRLGAAFYLGKPVHRYYGGGYARSDRAGYLSVL